MFVANPDGGRICWCQPVSGEVYEFTLHDCNCPGAEYRCRENSPRRKHSLALEKVQEGEVLLAF